MATTSQRTSGLSFSQFADLNKGDNNNQQGASSSSTTREPLPEAEFWMNVGYYSSTPTDEDPDHQTFVSVARGTPLDQIKPFDVSKERTDNMATLRAAQNALLERLLAAGEQLAPGDERTVNLTVQIKRKKAPAQAASNDENPLMAGVELDF